MSYSLSYSLGEKGREIGRKWFTNRVVDKLNRVSNVIVGTETVGSFKRFDKVMENKVIPLGAETVHYSLGNRKEL